MLCINIHMWSATRHRCLRRWQRPVLSLSEWAVELSFVLEHDSEAVFCYKMFSFFDNIYRLTSRLRAFFQCGILSKCWYITTSFLSRVIHKTPVVKHRQTKGDAPCLPLGQTSRSTRFCVGNVWSLSLICGVLLVEYIRKSLFKCLFLWC